MMQLCGSVAATNFDRTTALTPVEGRPGEFLVELDAGWSSLVGVHGGYLCASRCGGRGIGAGAVGAHDVHELPAAGRVGPALLAVREVRRGRSVTTMVADLLQDGQTLTVNRLTLMTARPGVEWSGPRRLELAPPEACVPLRPRRAW